MCLAPLKSVAESFFILYIYFKHLICKLNFRVKNAFCDFEKRGLFLTAQARTCCYERANNLFWEVAILRAILFCDAICHTFGETVRECWRRVLHVERDECASEQPLVIAWSDFWKDRDLDNGG